MSFISEDPSRKAADRALLALAQGRPVSDIEDDKVDFKEDPTRRDRRGLVIDPGPTRHDDAALFLADAAGCMSNSGGGAIIVGVEDTDGDLIGTNLDTDWLRGRIHDLTERRLTCAIEEVNFSGARLLVIIAPPAQEPIRVRGRAKNRVGGRCVEIDVSQWMASHRRRIGFDWSAQRSGVPYGRVSAAALDVARRYLRSSGEERAIDLAASEDSDLLRRMGAVEADGVLTNGAALLFTAEARRVLIDYRRREFSAGDSLLRLDRDDLSLLQAIAETEQAIAQANRTVHISGVGLSVGQIRAVPDKAVREGLANAVSHRDWGVSDPIIVEFVGDTLVVQSPGGFVEGVDPQRLLTTPPRSRNPHLADLLRRLRIAESEGVGIDRMYREMVRLGHRPPEITELPGPHVRCTLIGGRPDVKVVRLMSALDPPGQGDDLDIALIVDALRRQPTISAGQLGVVLQKPSAEASAALQRAEVTMLGPPLTPGPLIAATARTAMRRSRDFRFAEAARTHFGRDLPYHRTRREDAVPFVVEFVRRHGRISNSDYVELFGVSQPYASKVLRDLAAVDGGEILRPGREPNLGRHAHHVAGAGFPEDAEVE